MRNRTRNSFSYRLDVDVARPFLDRRHHHQVHEPDDRRLTPLPLEGCDVDLLHLLEQLDIVVDDLRARFLERLADQVQRGGAGEIRLDRRGLFLFGLLVDYCLRTRRGGCS